METYILLSILHVHKVDYIYTYFVSLSQFAQINPKICMNPMIEDMSYLWRHRTNNSIMDDKWLNEQTEKIENKILCLVIVFRYVFYA